MKIESEELSIVFNRSCAQILQLESLSIDFYCVKWLVVVFLFTISITKAPERGFGVLGFWGFGGDFDKSC